MAGHGRRFVHAATSGFERTAPASFTNGRATVRLDGNALIAVPGDGTKAWRTDLKDAQPETICYLLTNVLAASSFLSQAELDLRASRQRTAEEALQNLAASIRDNPDTHSGQHLRRFVWSIFNGNHALNLWRMKDVLDVQQNAQVTEVFTAWMQGGALQKPRFAARCSTPVRWTAGTPSDSEPQKRNGSSRLSMPSPTS